MAEIQDILALLSGENLANAAYQFRYGMNAPEKVALADTGKPLGVSPEVAQNMPAEADRAASVYAGAQKWGATPAMSLHFIRQALGGDAGNEEAMTNAAIAAASRQAEEQNRRNVEEQNLLNSLRGR